MTLAVLDLNKTQEANSTKNDLLKTEVAKQNGR
jgi:hypothetical protein